MWSQEVEAGSVEDTRTSETGNISFILVHPAPVIHPLLFQDLGQRSYKAAVTRREEEEGRKFSTTFNGQQIRMFPEVFSRIS